jgi:putative acetyltransferase
VPSAGSYLCRVEVTIRAYEPRDAADLADVFFRSVRQVARSAYTATQVRAWAPEPRTAEWAHREASDGRLVLVAADADDRPVAYIDLEPDGHIDRVFCTPEAAGQGIASRLYDAVEAAAREQQITSLFTEASELARRLFERKGFAVVERQDLVVRGVAIHNYWMTKALDLPALHLIWSGVAGVSYVPRLLRERTLCSMAAEAAYGFVGVLLGSATAASTRARSTRPAG